MRLTYRADLYSSLGLGSVTTSVWNNNDLVPISNNAAPAPGAPTTYAQLKDIHLLRLMTSDCTLGGTVTCPNPTACLTPTTTPGSNTACPAPTTSPDVTTCFYDVGSAQQCALAKTAGSDTQPAMCLDTCITTDCITKLTKDVVGPLQALRDHEIATYIAHLSSCSA
jgi:hypothetical protein